VPALEAAPTSVGALHADRATNTIKAELEWLSNLEFCIGLFKRSCSRRA